MVLQIHAQFDIPLSLKAQYNGSYGYTIIGNTHNEFDNWQSPSSPCQVLSQSTATLNLLPNQTIVAAYLYWSGVGDGTFDNNISLNGINYSSSAINVGYPDNNPLLDYFGSFIDVSSQVISSGNGTYTFSDLDLDPLLGSYCGSGLQYAGWHLLVVYNEVGLPNNQLNIYDGFNVVSTYFNNGVTNLTIDNLSVIDNLNAKMTYVAWNGSPNLFFIESIILNGNVLSNVLNPSNNPFNGTNSITGSTTNWNQDIDTFDISSYINIGDTQANITFNSYPFRFIQTLVTSIRSELPDATAQINQVTGQATCGNRSLVVSYKVANNNSNAVLPANVPVSFYANSTLLQTINTPASIAIGGFANFTITVAIPLSIPNAFNLRVMVDNSVVGTSTIAESNENNNEALQSITLSDIIINPTFNIASDFCQNATVPVLPTTSNNNISGIWLPNVINNQANGGYVFMPNAGQCAVSFTLNVVITQSITPTFNIANNFCQNATVPVLPTTSIINILGTWLPSAIDNQTSSTYLFTPNAGQCAVGFTLNVVITPSITPRFNIANNFCQNATVPVLSTISNNSISGTWLPSAIDNQTSGVYLFTPNAGQCASSFTFNTIIQTPNVVSENLVICKDILGAAIEPVLLSSKLNANTFTFAWILNTQPINQNTSSISVLIEGNYQVIAISNIGGCQQILKFNVAPIYPITANIVTSDDFAEEQSIAITAVGGSGDYSYSFDKLPFQNNPIFNTAESGEILVKVKDNSNCYDFSKTITLWQYPRFFSPNNDGINDTWGIKTKKPITINIFDRFGKLVQQLQSGANWNGTFNNQLLLANDYWFVIYYDENKSFRGHFLLLR